MAEDSEPNYAAKGATTSVKSPAMQKVLDILMWKNVKVSGGVFACGMGWFYMTIWGGSTVLSLASFLIFLHLVGNIAKNMAFKSQEPHSPYQLDVEDIKKAVGSAVNDINAYLRWYWTLLSAANNMAALQVAGVLLVTWTVGSWFEFYTLLFLAFLISFSVPVAYQANKKVCDEKIAMVTNQIKAAYENAKAKIPKAGQSEDGKKSK